MFLDDCIAELLEIEHFWKICYPCECRGLCCKGADIMVSAAEWKAVISCVEELSRQDVARLKKNIAWYRLCPFRVKERCLIHSVRPENCRYTPFQCVYHRDDKRVHYGMVKKLKSGACRFRAVAVSMDGDALALFLSSKFVRLDNFGRPTYYLNLNWLETHGQEPGHPELRSVSSLLYGNRATKQG